MAQNRIKGITIELGGDTTKLDKALAGVRKSLAKTQTALKDVNKLLKLDPGNVGLLTQKQQLLNKAVEDTKEKLKVEKEALEQLKKADPSPEVTEQMQLLERQIVDDEQALEKLKGEQKKFGSVAQQSIKAAADKVVEFGKAVQEAGKKVKGVGDDLTKNVTAPLVAFGTLSIAAFTEVDDAMDTLIKRTGASGEAFEEMEGIVETLATSIPIDFMTAADAVAEVSTRFGLTGEALEDLSEKFIKFAELNDTDVSKSIDTVQSALAMFGLSAEDAGNVLDMLNKAAQDTGTPVDTLAQALLTSGTALQEMGFGINESIGFLSQLEKSGVSSSEVMGGLKKALQNATAEGKPLNKALEEMQKQMQGAKTDTEAAQIAADLFGKKAGPGIAAAVRDGRLSFDELSASVQNFGGSVEETYAATQDDIDGFTLAVNSGKLLLAEVGDVVGSQLAPVFDELREGVQGVKEAWDGLGPDTQDAIVKGLMIAAVIGPIISGVGSLIIGIGGLITSVGTIAGVMAPVIAGLGAFATAFGAPVIAIGAAIAAFVLFITHIKDVERITNEVVAAVAAKWEELKAKLGQTIENIKATVAQKWEAIKTSVSNTAEKIRSTVAQKFEAVKTAITKPIEAAKSSVENAINKIKGIVNNAKLSLPHFKLPHFRISGGEVPWGIGGVGTKPTISVDWYKSAYENPVIFTQPTVLPTLGGLKGFGDGSGAEIVMSLNKLREMVGAGSVTNNIVVNAAPGMNVSDLADAVAERIEFTIQRQRAVYG